LAASNKTRPRIKSPAERAAKLGAGGPPVQVPAYLCRPPAASGRRYGDLGVAVKYELVTEGRPESLATILDFVAQACILSGIEQEALLDLQLAVEEACSNVIKHAYQEQGGKLRLCLETHGPDAVITVQDRGQPFDPEQVPDPDLTIPLDERPSGGLGLYLMQQLMDEVAFTFSEEHGNTLVMVKQDVVPERPARKTTERADDG
jgi:serine/threonine-protein kinase RsbW